MPSRPPILKSSIAEARRQSNATLGYDRAWNRLSRYVLANEPLCRECDRNGYVTLATDVDHIVPKAQGGSNELDNLQPLCKSCHAKKTRSGL